MRVLVAIFALAGCADQPFTYSVSVPSNHVIEGHEGQTTVEVVFDSYEQALEDLSLVVIRDTRRRELQVGCGGDELGTPLSESVHFSTSTLDPTGLYIDTRTCEGTDGGRVIVDCGC